MIGKPENSDSSTETGNDGRAGVLSSEALSLLMPMSVTIGATGHILRAGPTLQKVFGETPLDGRRFLEVFELRRPTGISGMPGLRRTSMMDSAGNMPCPWCEGSPHNLACTISRELAMLSPAAQIVAGPSKR